MDDAQFGALLDELRVISAKVRKEVSLFLKVREPKFQEMMNKHKADWMFAAMVIDRLCFVTFTFFLVLCTLVISYRAPHLFV